MNEKPMLTEVREFLEGLGYLFVTRKDGYFARIDGVYGYGHTELDGDESEVLVDCLEHYLVSELGKHWELVWHGTDIQFHLDADNRESISKAATYYEALKDERT